MSNPLAGRLGAASAVTRAGMLGGLAKKTIMRTAPTPGNIVSAAKKVGGALAKVSPTPKNLVTVAKKIGGAVKSFGSKTPDGFLASKISSLWGGGIKRTKQSLYNPIAGQNQTYNLRGNVNKQRPLPGINAPLRLRDFNAAGVTDRRTQQQRIQQYHGMLKANRYGS